MLLGVWLVMVLIILNWLYEARVNRGRGGIGR